MIQELDTKRIDAALERAARKSLSGTREERSGRFMAPKAFISYSHDSAEHKAWVLKLATDLRAIGVDVTFDRWDLVPGQDISLFMQRGISEADRVVLVCSSSYVSKSEKGVGGVGFERLIVTGEVVRSIDTTKFIPVLRGSDPDKRIPSFLGPRLYVDFNNDREYDAKLIELAREIHNAPAVSKPALGPNPFSGKAVRLPAPDTGALTPKRLDNEWFSAEESNARIGIEKLGFEGQMELRVGISYPIVKSQIELLNAVKQSEIRTFGWPIGITLENRDEYRPRPYGDGIRAEVSIGGKLADRQSYDYWSLRSNGDFYLLQSFFEDTRTTNKIFFDTRIVRITECLMFIEGLYNKLGAPSKARAIIRVKHGGLNERSLESASPYRLVFPRSTSESVSSSEIEVELGKMKETRIDDVRNLLEPMFMLFDYSQFAPTVYSEIVRNFEQGKVI
jgi:hypothetical protein